MGLTDAARGQGILQLKEKSSQLKLAEGRKFMRRHTTIFLMVLLLVGGAGLVPSVSTACCGGKCDVCRASLL